VLFRSLIKPLVLKPGATTITFEDDDHYIAIYGGDWVNHVGGGAISLVGFTLGGYVSIFTPNAANTAQIEVATFTGQTATPVLNMRSHRITSLADPTTSGDALPYQAWANYSSLTHTWLGATPASWMYSMRYTKIGKTCFYSYEGSSADSNATTGLTITVMPYTAAAKNYHGQWINGTGAGGSTFNDVLGYVPSTVAGVQFLRWVTPTDGQPLYVQGSGFYEVE